MGFLDCFQRINAVDVGPKFSQPDQVKKLLEVVFKFLSGVDVSKKGWPGDFDEFRKQAGTIGRHCYQEKQIGRISVY